MAVVPRHLTETPWEYAHRASRPKPRKHANANELTSAAGAVGGGAIGGLGGFVLGAVVGAAAGAGIASATTRRGEEIGVAAFIGGMTLGVIGGIAGGLYGTYKGAAMLAPEGEEHEAGMGALGGMVVGSALGEATGIDSLGVVGTGLGAAYGARQG